MVGGNWYHEKSIRKGIAKSRKKRKKLIPEAVTTAQNRAAAKGQTGVKVRVLFADEARFGRISDTRRCWAPPGVRPLVGAQVVQQYTYVFSAICPFDGQLTCLVLPEVNTEMMSIFLKTISDQYPDEYLAIIMDQAGWHRAKRLERPENITIHWLPPYSPELNPVEHFWDDLREKFFSNRLFDSLEQLEDHLVSALQHYLLVPDVLRSMSHFSWMKLE